MNLASSVLVNRNGDGALLQKGWRPGLILLALVFSLPVLTVVSFLFQPSGDVWQHLISTVLSEYVTNSLILMIGVAIGTLSIGVCSAWLTSLFTFPGSRFFSWALLLPLAFPAYIIAYTYTGMLDFAGPVQTWIREMTGWGYGDYYFPPVRSLGGAIVMFSLVLYPYVFMLTRAAFMDQSVSVLEVSRTLGCNLWTSFYRVAIPMARPAIIAGVTLALMETLADYGTVSFFGLPVFTTGIFRTWFGLGDSVAAAKLSSLLLFFIFAMVVVERWSRRQAQYHQTSQGSIHRIRMPLKGIAGWIAFVLCLIPFGFGFLLPALQLLSWAVETYDLVLDASFIRLTMNTLLLALVTALLAVLLALFFAYGKRLLGGKAVRSAIQVVSLGYAVPGTVVAVGVIIPFAWLDNSIDAWMRDSFGISTGLLLSGTLFAVVFAYLVRFLAISVQTVESGLVQITPSMDEAARSMACRPGQVLSRVHVPLLKRTVLTAALIVFVEVMKELPATLILRPFNFNTLAVRAYELASDERLAESSIAALMIVAVGLIPVILLSRNIMAGRQDKQV